MDKNKIIKNKKTTFYLLLLITLAGTFFRLWRISYQSLWVDEFVTLFIAEQSLLEVIKYSFIYPYYTHHPPVYTIIMHFVLYLGNSEFLLRLPSAIFGIITIPISYLLAKELFTRKVGLITALILAFSSLHIWMSQDARPYTLLPLVVITSIYFFVKFINEKKTRFLFWFIIFTVISLLTHYFAVFALFAVNLFMLFNIKKYKDVIKKWFIYQIPIVLFLVLLVPIVFINYSRHNFYRYDLSWFLVTIPGIFNTANIGRFNPYINLGAELSFDTLLGGLFNSIPLFIVWFLITSVFVYLFFKGLLSVKREKFSFLFLFFFIPILVPYMANFFFPFFLGAKRILYAVIIYYIIIAKGIIDSKKFTNLLIIFIVINSTISLGWYYYKYEQEDWRSTAQYLSENTLQGDIIVSVPSAIAYPLKYYYEGKGYIDYRENDLMLQSRITAINVGVIEDLTRGYERAWIIENRDPEVGNMILNYLNERPNNYQFLKSEHFSDGFINVHLYRIKE